MSFNGNVYGFNGDKVGPMIYGWGQSLIPSEYTELMKLSFLPKDKHKWDVDKTSLVFPVYANRVGAVVGASEDNTIKIDGLPTVKLSSTNNATSAITFNSELSDLSAFDYLDILVRVENVEDLATYEIRVTLMTDTTNHFMFELASIRQAIDNSQWRQVRLKLNEPTTITGAPSLSNITQIKFNHRAKTDATTAINLGKVSVSKIPFGVIHMHFDDGFLTQYTNAFRIMQQYQLKGLINVITSWPGNRQDAVTWEHLREMQSAGWTIASHSHTHPNFTTITESEARADFELSQATLNQNGFFLASKFFVAPYGAWSVALDKIAKDYFKVIRIGDAYSGVFPPTHPRLQKYRSPQADSTVQSLKDRIDFAIANKKEVVFAWHGIVETGASGVQYNCADFEEICAYIRQKVDEGVLLCTTWREMHLQRK